MIRTPDDVTAAALAAMEQTDDPRLREILVGLVDHLHAFVRDVALTEEEFRAAATIFNRIGQASTDSHNEAVLLAGSLGLSNLVCLLNNGNEGATETTQNMLGPFWRLHQPPTANDASIVRSDTPGDPLFVTLRLVDTDGEPVAGARVDVWHSSPDGLYENQDPSQADHNLRATFTSDGDGQVRFRSVRPAGYPIPTDGVVGDLLAAQHRHPFRPAHLHALAVADGYRTPITQIYDADDPHLDTDPQFGVTASLVGRYLRHNGPHPSDPDVDGWYSLEHTLVMEPGRPTLPDPPIR